MLLGLGLDMPSMLESPPRYCDVTYCGDKYSSVCICCASEEWMLGTPLLWNAKDRYW